MNGGGGQFRSKVWDPFLLISQILAMQCIFYTSLGLWVFALDLLTGTYKSLDQIFKYQNFFVKELGGSRLLVSYLFNSATCAIGLWYVVQRSKLCLDFAVTVHVVHLVLCWLFNGAPPSYLSWWLLQAVCIAVTTVLAEYLCLQTELRAIPVSLGPKVDL